MQRQCQYMTVTLVTNRRLAVPVARPASEARAVQRRTPAAGYGLFPDFAP